ncbi:multiple sugar transport system substrate-binding protein/alpha-glucoside transport system substrate-binding protein [Allostreptomyces psammosilenae]|uniref:Multiple sugar transport system substrate-binding protein/alpha-glucoside transport system substrate-binding protein n=2 Tax=Allostreptomyces psammosilenae TaxID=1892865 RepID=A0A852ZWY2_9ACTN|nr:extracellular solute-binding protein [Allostreptomyces psammosilenae]NYI06197.1 multiple sugar transport system substrate-binding protein/alpha-glucoside transport system substrate-binding protein [Allostreptomyces psammosilenae]
MVVAAGCGSDGGGAGGDTSQPPASDLGLPDLSGQTIEVAAIWSGEEQANFQKVLDDFSARTGAQTSYVPTGDNVSTFLGTRVEGGQPPDVAFLPQVGVLQQFAESGWLQPVSADVQEALDANYGTGWKELGAWEGEQYGVYFKAANKSTLWYSPTVFEQAGVTPPTTWEEFLTAAQTISDSGTPPLAVGGADGWVLTDLFENVYLSQAGPEMYDRLAAHEIPWTDPSVTEALETLGELFGNDTLLAGGAQGALQTDFPTSVTQTFSDPPGAGMVYEGDFVAGVIASDTEAVVGEDAQVFPFPAVGDTPPVVTAGDVAVAMTEGEAAQALLTYLASPDAARIWAGAGGFLSPNRSLEMEAYADETTRTIAQALIDAGDDFRFDMSDQAPAAFGGTKGQGEWKDLQDFLANPSDVAGAQAALEEHAAEAYGG